MQHKARYMMFTVGVFIGSYYLFQYIKDHIKDSWSDIINYIRKLKPSSVRMPTQVSQAFAEVRADAEAVREAGGAVTGSATRYRFTRFTRYRCNI